MHVICDVSLNYGYSPYRGLNRVAALAHCGSQARPHRNAKLSLKALAFHCALPSGSAAGFEMVTGALEVEWDAETPLS